jgi:riboflavin biosynthesis pyrimidine reductase
MLNGKNERIHCSKQAQLYLRCLLSTVNSVLRHFGLLELILLLGQLSIPEVLQKLRDLGICSLMVEGGATVIASFLSATSMSKPAVDVVIVTVAPTFVGGDGGYQLEQVTFQLCSPLRTSISVSLSQIPSLQHVATEVFGRDAVVAMKVVPDDGEST